MKKNICRGQFYKLAIKAIGVFTIAASLSACVTFQNIPLPQEVSEKLEGKKIVLTKYSTPDFVATTAGKAAFALLGAVAMIVEGNEIVKENGIEDPALKISQGLAKKLSEERGITLISNQNISSASDDVQKLVSAYPGADYLLDVKTFNWWFHYYPGDWAHYRVSYNARLRLIDSSTKKVIAEEGCKSTQGDDKNPPSKDQLLDNKASLLKAYLGQAASGCINLFSKDILKLSVEQNTVGIGAALLGMKTAIPISNQKNPLTPASNGNAEDKVPFVSAQCQSNFQLLKTKSNPRAFAISKDGHCGYAYSISSRIGPSDPKERAIANCKKTPVSIAFCILLMIRLSLISSFTTLLQRLRFPRRLRPGLLRYRPQHLTNLHFPALS